MHEEERQKNKQLAHELSRKEKALARIFHEILPQAAGRGVFMNYLSIIIFYLVIVQKTALRGGILFDFH